MRYLPLLAALLAVSSPVFAMMKKKEAKPPVDVCCFDDRWTGFTFGLNAGALINASHGQVKPTGDFKLPANVADNPQRTDSFHMHGSAFITGAQFGYNYQVKVFVWGLETDFNYSTLHKKHHHSRTLTGALAGTFNDHVDQLFNWWGTARGRIGYAFKTPVLIYGTGGFAYGHVKSKSHIDFQPFGDQFEGSRSQWRIGWTLGAGLEWGFTRHWSMKTEYLYVQLREVNYTDTNRPPPAAPTFTYQSEMNTRAHMVRFGIQYKI